MRQMQWLALVWLMTWFGSVGVVFGQTDDAANEQRRRLVEQKLRLVEMLVASPAAKSSAYGREAETPALVEKGRQLLEQARQAHAAGQPDRALGLLDEALRNASRASNKLSGQGSLSESALTQSLKDLNEQIATYRAALLEVSGTPARELQARVDALTDEARRLAAGGRLGDANKKAGEAYKIIVEGLSKLRAGQEVVMSLNFASKAEEYAYEQKRLRSSEIMVDMLLGEGRAEGDARKLVERYIGDSRRLRDEAEDLARNHRHAEAVTGMEKALQQLNRALQMMGVPVF